ncbi:hypothetical protein GYMLUDRAFT_39413 [Collybiopsis luxurians FD-317 M1]|nr:hypothetical protein GYMLUDRAFT_39413 [Collybiopsis luxurians FD-317 M1]
MVSPSTSSGAFVNAPVPTANFEETWAFLSNGADHVMMRLDSGLDYLGYINFYTTVFNYCSDKTRTGLALYLKLKEYFVEHLKPMKEKAAGLQDEALLRYYATEWDRYITGANVLDHLFSYLNRSWVKRERDEGERDVYPVYTLALSQWRQHFFMPIQKEAAKLAGALLCLIERHRNGEVIDQGLVKKVVFSFVSLGLDNYDPYGECLEIYKEHLETPFIEAAAHYYRKESEMFLTSNTLSEYLKKAEDRLREEEDRIEWYLHPETHEELISKCEHVLIREHSELMWENFEKLLGFDQDEDLERMYALLSRIPDGLDPLPKIFEAYVKLAGLSSISKLVEEGNAESIDPKVYIDALLKVYKKNSETVARGLKSEAGFSASLDRACREFVNRNAATGFSSSKSAELIVEHADMLLRKNNKMAEEEDLQGALNRMMVLIKYLEDKDAFQTLYTTKLSKRLIDGVSASDESEVSMILKLMRACGFEYTVEIQRTFANKKLDKCDKDEDLARLYALLSPMPEGLDCLRKKFYAFVTQAGLLSISKLVGEAENVENIDPKVYVDALLGVYEKNSETVGRSFESEAGFAASLDKACREFVNRNAATGSSSTKSAEIIAKYADMLLRKNNNKMAEEDLEGALNGVMVLFKYLEDKDVFQTFYTTKLSKRLIHGISASDESEASMISKLKEACGFEYTNKLQRMFTDVSLSKDLTDNFKERMSQSHDDMDITFSIMILGTNFWPLSPPMHEFVVPAEILTTYNRFQKYYQYKHAGRKLTWLWNLSKNELRANYLNQKYILMTSSYQMAVLVLYNKNDTMSLDEIFAATSISKDILTQVLAVLVKAKILINEESEQYDLNPGFKSKKIRVNLNLPVRAEVKQESNEILKAVDENRKYAIQAAIVRIVKARKTIKIQALIQEVILQISHRFAPKIPDIKKGIEMLIEKEYIERVGGSKDMFAYVA